MIHLNCIHRARTKDRIGLRLCVCINCDFVVDLVFVRVFIVLIWKRAVNVSELDRFDLHAAIVR